jgi:hypothetical protein
MDKEPPSLVAAHDRRDAMQPALPNRFRAVDHSQHAVLLVDTLNQFAHEPTVPGAAPADPPKPIDSTDRPT